MVAVGHFHGRPAAGLGHADPDDLIRLGLYRRIYPQLQPAPAAGHQPQIAIRRRRAVALQRVCAGPDQVRLNTGDSPPERVLRQAQYRIIPDLLQLVETPPAMTSIPAHSVPSLAFELLHRLAVSR